MDYWSHLLIISLARVITIMKLLFGLFRFNFFVKIRHAVLGFFSEGGAEVTIISFMRATYPLKYPSNACLFLIK